MAAICLAAGLPIHGGTARAAPPELEFPVACEIGRDCFVQFYVDRDPGPGTADYSCGGLTYDGHKGIDFRLADLPAMRRGVAVRAAAAGTVRAVRDGEPDAGLDENPGSTAGKEAGNAVVLVHDDGWETHYSHLMLGSVTVRPGERVAAGAPLGLIGLSGNSTFPHVEFSVRHEGKIVDPFGGQAAPGCDSAGRSLWSPAAAKAIPYLPGAVLLAGFAAQAPDRHAVRRGAHRARELSRLAPVLIFWVDMFGSAAGDIERFRILAPDGSVVAERTRQLPDAAHQHFDSIGRRRSDVQAWPPGTYRGEYLLFRDIGGERRPLIGAVREVTLR